MASDLEHLLWSHAMDNGNYDYDEQQQEIRNEMEDDKLRHMAFASVYLDPDSPLGERLSSKSLEKSDKQNEL